MKSILIKLLTIIFGVILAIVVIEIGLHLIPDVAWKGLISKNPTRYVLYQSNKDIGWVHIPNARTNWQGTGEYDVEIEINSQGLRDREHTYEKPPDTFRVLILGDSFANAIEVPLEQTFPVRLEDCLNERMGRKIEVINGGVAAYGPGDELLLFANEGVKYQPDLVLVAVYATNDMKDMERAVDDNMIQSFGGYKFYFDSGHLKKQWIEWAEPDYEISSSEHFLRRYSTLYYVFRAPDSRVRREVGKRIERLWPDSPSAPQPLEEKPAEFPDYAYDEYLIVFSTGFPDNPIVPPYIKELWELLKAVFLELQTEVERQGAQLAVVIIPSQAQIHEEFYVEWISKYMKKYDALNDTSRDAWDISAPNQAIINYMPELDIPVLDLMPGFQAYDVTHDDLLYFRKDIHFNEKGHQLAADLMCDWLIEKALVPSE